MCVFTKVFFFQTYASAYDAYAYILLLSFGIIIRGHVDGIIEFAFFSSQRRVAHGSRMPTEFCFYFFFFRWKIERAQFRFGPWSTYRINTLPLASIPTAVITIHGITRTISEKTNGTLAHMHATNWTQSKSTQMTSIELRACGPKWNNNKTGGKICESKINLLFVSISCAMPNAHALHISHYTI